MTAALQAGFCYFAVAFAVGFVLGTLRVLAIAPTLGEVASVALELPAMLAVSWVACRWLVRRFAVPARPGPRLAMGSIAFALLMLAELGVSIFAFGRSAAEHVATYRNAAAQLGLAAQLGFALLPLGQALLRRFALLPLGQALLRRAR
ncbi:hypothetical protein [Falsiroseomonas tokyonensis]|uniref:Uncharacterized protein n=1 Tax=Falsiroseomonas tokyonensis TaxID=430521 RepID=A0ABV7C0K3_9PROT|nr:hypothetical protein [Falsiroseomonas tokyonensis]MBU8541432.1 hypothetical protein [Falsiroseomonas tokyonensis]